MNIDRLSVRPKGGLLFLGYQTFNSARALVLLSLSSLLMLPAAAQVPFDCTTNNGTITITGYTGDGGAVEIPPTINGRNVTGIRNSAFFSQPSITSIAIPSTVTVIGNGAFSQCSGLTAISVNSLNKNYSSVDGVLFDKNQTTLLEFPAGRGGNYTVPSSVTTIDDGAFYGCAGLSALSIPNSVISVGDNAFYNCTGLSTMTIPNSVTSIGYAAFFGCSSLSGVAIADSVTSIGEGAFSGCTSLTSIEIPNSVTRIGNDTFSGCTALSSIIMPNAVTAIGSYAFFGCSSITNITIPNSVTTIGYEAFYACTGLTSITIPNKVTSLGNNTFYGCTSLNSVTIPVSVTSIGDYAFSGCTNLTSLAIPNKVTRIGNYTFYNCVSLNSIALSNNITSIGAGAFSGCASLNNVTVPTRLISIGNNMFSDCISLTSIVLPLRITSIGNYAFSGCTVLTNITMHSRVKSIGNNAFSGCTGLTNIALPTGVRTIGGDAFSGCVNLTGITFSSSLSTIANNLFLGCTSLTNITIPATATSVGDHAFAGCTSLTRITVPSRVKSIGNSAFLDCTALTNVTIASTVASIGDYAFSGCTGLIGITLPSAITSISDYTFAGCSGLTSITIPSRVTRIGNYAFADCIRLTRVIMYNRVASIGVSAFAGCTSLMNISLPASIVSVGSQVFSGCPALTSVFFQGNTPPSVDPGVFQGSSAAKVYYPSGKAGWGTTFSGAPVVLLTAPLIVQPPTNRLVQVGSSVTLGVTVYGPSTLTYQWRLNGTNIAGARSSTYTLSSAQPRNAGSYSVVVANTYGSVVSSSGVLAFKPTGAGVYKGLIVGADPLDSTNSGMFALTVTANGGFSARLSFAAQTVSGSGKIRFNGDDTNYLTASFAAKVGGRSVNVAFTVALDASSLVTGAITPADGSPAVAEMNGAMVADINLGSFNAAVLPAGSVPATGNGFGSLSISNTGVKINLALPDDKAVVTAFATDRLKNGLIPIFVPLYGTKGFLAGWLTVTNQQLVSLSPLTWHKAPGASTTYSPNGFNQQVEIEGGLYTPVTDLSQWGNAGLFVDSQSVQSGYVNYTGVTIAKGILSIPASDGQNTPSAWAVTSATGAVTLFGDGVAGKGILVPSTAPEPGIYGFTTQLVNGAGVVRSIYSGPEPATP